MNDLPTPAAAPADDGNKSTVRASLSKNSDGHLHMQILGAASRFYEANPKAETGMLLSAFATVSVDVLLNLMRKTFPDLQPGQFQKFVTQVAGLVERGEHINGGLM